MMNPSPPNSPTPIFFWNAMPIDTPLAAQRNESFWQISSPPSFARSIGEDLAGVGRGERDLLDAPAAAVREDRHEQALAGQQALAGAEQRAHDAALACSGCCRRRTPSPSGCRAS